MVDISKGIHHRGQASSLEPTWFVK